MGQDFLISAKSFTLCTPREEERARITFRFRSSHAVSDPPQSGNPSSGSFRGTRTPMSSRNSSFRANHFASPSISPALRYAQDDASDDDISRELLDGARVKGVDFRDEVGACEHVSLPFTGYFPDCSECFPNCT